MIRKKNIDMAITQVTVTTGQTTASVTVPVNSAVIGIVPTTNQDQFVDNVAISGTTLTVTLAGAATANNVFNVTTIV